MSTWKVGEILTAAKLNQMSGDVEESAEEAKQSAEDSEAWAVGTRDGVDVPSTDPAYQNSSKWWAEHPQTTPYAASKYDVISIDEQGRAFIWIKGDDE